MAKSPSYHVLVGSRSTEKGNDAIKQLQSRNLAGTAELIALDVTNDETIEQAAATVQREHGKLDILVNNAAIAALTPPLRQQMRDAFDVNATGPAIVTSAFAPLLKQSTGTARIINVSSGAGSIARRLDTTSPSALHNRHVVQYRASKAALSMVTACDWVEYGPAIKVFAYCPGFTVSNLGPQNKAEHGAKPTAEAVMPLIDVLEGKRDGEAGLFLHNTGIYPW